MTAVISEDGRYRYRLERDIAEQRASFSDAKHKQTLGVIMINPSTADASINDATISRLIGFASNYGCNKLVVGNLFAFRSPLVTDLRNPDIDPTGPDNWLYLQKMMEESRDGRLVVGFGSFDKIPKNHFNCLNKLIELADANNVTLWCWGTNRDGSPKHPLYLASSTGLEPWAWRPEN